MISQKEKITTKNQHLGLQTLRTCLCLLVIYNHVPTESTGHLPDWLQIGFHLLCTTAVPCFVMMSFYLSAPLFLQTYPVSIKQFTKKIRRPLLPFIGWSIAGFLVYPKRISVTNIALQFLFGATVNAPLYYLSITIYFYTFFILLTYLNFKLRVVILCLLTAFCFYLQYTAKNYNFFSIFPESSQYTLGRFCELFPFAVIGVFQKYFFDMTKCSQANYKVNLRLFLIVAPMFIVGAMLHLFFYPKGFGYQGIGLLMCVFSIFLLFLIQSNAKLTTLIPNFVLSISTVSLGIFCCHYLLNRIIRSWFGSLDVYKILISIPFLYGLLLFCCSTLLCLKLRNSFNGRLKPFVS